MQSIKRWSPKIPLSFGYNIQRDYDLWWFTPVTIIGGLVGIVFFSLINLASNGYDLTLKYTSDPDAVLDESTWYLSWSWDKQLQPNCSEQNIPVGAQLFTSNLGFSYTLESVQMVDQADPGRVTEEGSLPYLGQPLENCTVERISSWLIKADQSTPGVGASWWSWDQSYVEARAYCAIRTREGPYNVEVMFHYKPQAAIYDFVIQSNYTESSNMWWAARLLNLYWYSTLTAVSQQLTGVSAPNTAPAWTGGGMTYTPTGIVNDITDPGFFHVDFHFLAANGTLINQDFDNVHDSTLLFNNASAHAYAESLTEGLMFARVMYSALLLDLGSNSTQNFLLDETLLRWILLHPDDTFRNNPNNILNATRRCLTPSEARSICYPHYGLISVIASPTAPVPENDLDNRNVSQLMSDAFDSYQPLMGPLRTVNNETVISSQYACQVPLRKPFGSVILPLLVADLVFLQACWKLLNWIATKWVEHRDKEEKTAMWCVGCLERFGKLADQQQLLAAVGNDTETDEFRQTKKSCTLDSRTSQAASVSRVSFGSNDSGDTAHNEEGDDTVLHKLQTSSGRSHEVV